MEQTFLAEMVVIADQQGFDCLEAMNRLLSLVLQRLDRSEFLPP